ncbi:MAG TPA: glycosyltransferase family 4 protein [Candidatus Acidoferrales bacterium]|nr:glycosyltransferase family 4 protein [Candidatus Acidoferrales bacterium]
MLSWEFPPRTVGGIAAHLFYLSRELVKLGVDTYIVTCDFPGAPEREMVNGAHVMRVDSYKTPSPDFATWDSLMNVNMQKETATLISDLSRQVDIIHAHDWLVANAALGLKQIFRIPLVATMHSTEIGRRNGLHTDYERMIHQTENWLAHESWRIICCSQYMAQHVMWAYGLPQDRVIVIPNGVDASVYEKEFDSTEFRKRFALPEEKIVLYVGRLVYEKGVQTLVNAIPKILSRVNAKFVVVGDGGMKDHLMRQVANMRLSHRIMFTGFLDEESLRKLYQIADVCVVPSLYEPFGITALEAMAAKTPLVVSNTGGLSEIVEHDKTGTKVYAGNADSLAWGITRILLDPGYADWIKLNAYKKALEVYDWTRIAKETKEFYERVLKEYDSGSWKPT